MRAKYIQAFMTEDKTARIVAWEFWPTVGWDDDTGLNVFDTSELATVGNAFLYTRTNPSDTWPTPRKIGTVVYAAFIAMMETQGFAFIEPVLPK